MIRLKTRKAASTAVCFVLVLSASLFPGPRVLAERTHETDVQAGIGFLAGFPQGEFDDNVEENGSGIGGDVLYSPSFIPFGVGVSMGFNYLFTETSIEDVDDRVQVASSNNVDDGVFSYDGGSGVTVKLYSGRTEDSQRFSLWLDCRVRYVVGGNAEYLKKGSIRTVGGKVAFDVIESRTDLLTGQIGVTIEI